MPEKRKPAVVPGRAVLVSGGDSGGPTMVLLKGASCRGSDPQVADQLGTYSHTTPVVGLGSLAVVCRATEKALSNAAAIAACLVPLPRQVCLWMWPV